MDLIYAILIALVFAIPCILAVAFLFVPFILLAILITARRISSQLTTLLDLMEKD